MEQEIIRWINLDSLRMNALRQARNLSLPDCYLAAGFVRNLVWDKLHNYKDSTQLNDIDLIYYNAEDISEDKDRELELKLSQAFQLPWSVKNQARMHLRNNDSQYQSTEDAMRYWPELETAIGARLNFNDEIEIIAPFGIESLFNKTITMNQLRPKPEIFKQRIREKTWLNHWPLLEVKLI